jgi:hypothetical protein
VRVAAVRAVLMLAQQELLIQAVAAAAVGLHQTVAQAAQA